MNIRQGIAAVALVCTVSLAGCTTTPERKQPVPPTMVPIRQLAGELGLKVSDGFGTNMLILSGERGTIVFNPALRGILIRNEVHFPGFRVVITRDAVSVPPGFAAECRKSLGPARAVAVEEPVKPPVKPPAERFHVVLDPGHGGQDPGAIGASGAYEKTVNLSVARLVAQNLEAAGVQVTMTRSGDQFVELNERAAIANRLGADAFVSMHADSATDRSVRGFTVFVVHTKAGYSDGDRAAKISGETGLTYSACQALLSRNRPRGLQLASLVRQQLGRVAAPDRGTQPGALRVLERSACPAVLIELGFMSNRSEEALLFDADYQQATASAIARGIVAFLK